MSRSGTGNSPPGQSPGNSLGVRLRSPSHWDPLGGVNRVFYGGFGNREFITLKGSCACVIEDLTSACFHR